MITLSTELIPKLTKSKPIKIVKDLFLYIHFLIKFKLLTNKVVKLSLFCTIAKKPSTKINTVTKDCKKKESIKLLKLITNKIIKNLAIKIKNVVVLTIELKCEKNKLLEILLKQ